MQMLRGATLIWESRRDDQEPQMSLRLHCCVLSSLGQVLPHRDTVLCRSRVL
jgi:hypothetical protein